MTKYDRISVSTGKRLLTTTDLASRLNISLRTVYRLIYSDEIPFAMKITRDWFFESDDVEQWLLDKKSTPYKKKPTKE